MCEIDMEPQARYMRAWFTSSQ